VNDKIPFDYDDLYKYFNISEDKTYKPNYIKEAFLHLLNIVKSKHYKPKSVYIYFYISTETKTNIYITYRKYSLIQHLEQIETLNTFYRSFNEFLYKDEIIKEIKFEYQVEREMT